MIRSMALVLTLGLMAVAISANGLMENKMETASTYYRMELKEKVTGKMAKEQVGRMKLNNLHLIDDGNRKIISQCRDRFFM